VFEALQERLYSTNELYRMLTSYVYPGKEVPLQDFRHWLNWMEGTGRVRVLGIRWAPGLRFQDSATYVNSIDVDEILEEEAEEALAGGAKAEEPAPEPAPVAAAAPAAPAAVAPKAPGTEWEPPEDDDFAEEPVAPARPAGAVAPAGAAPQVVAFSGGAAQVVQVVQAPEMIEARLLRPAPHLSVLAAGVPLERVREAMSVEPRVVPEVWLEELTPGPEAVAENVRALLEWWRGVEARPQVRADQHGLMPFGAGGWEQGTRAQFLFRLSCLAVELLRGGPQGDLHFATLDGAGFFGALYARPGSVERLMDELFEQGLGSRPELFGRLHLHLMLARSLRGAEAWCEDLAELSGAEVFAGLWQRLAAYQLHEETLWVARELSLFGILRQPELREARVVPTEDVRRAAFHLGLIESSKAGSLPSLLAISRRLTPMLGHELEAPLMALWRTYGAHPPRAFWSR
jgi:hypothetical protein